MIPKTVRLAHKESQLFPHLPYVLIFLLALVLFNYEPAESETFTCLDSEKLRSAVVPLMGPVKVPFMHSSNIANQFRVEEERIGWPGCVMRKRVK